MICNDSFRRQRYCNQLIIPPEGVLSAVENQKRKILVVKQCGKTPVACTEGLWLQSQHTVGSGASYLNLMQARWRFHDPDSGNRYFHKELEANNRAESRAVARNMTWRPNFIVWWNYYNSVMLQCSYNVTIESCNGDLSGHSFCNFKQSYGQMLSEGVVHNYISWDHIFEWWVKTDQ